MNANATSEIVLQTLGLRREYRLGRSTITTLDGIDTAFKRGEFVAIMGPSGCGKSTLLNLLGGLDQPTAGRVLLDGKDLSDLDEEHLAQLRREKIGFVFQRHDLFPVLTARENIEFPMLLSGCEPGLRHCQADTLLELVGLSDKGDFLPDELSGGQQQRVGLARSLANNPMILLADEPTGNLDNTTAAEVMTMLMDLVRKVDLTLIMVTHDAENAQQADRILRLKDGRLENANDL